MSEKQAFVHTEEVELSTGKSVKLPPLTLRKILTLTNSVSKLFTAVKEQLPADIFKGGTPGTSMVAEIAKVLPQLIPSVLEELTEVLSKYLGVEKDEMLDNYTTEDLVAVATPFFASIFKSANVVVGKFNELFPTATAPVEAPASESSPAPQVPDEESKNSLPA